MKSVVQSHEKYRISYFITGCRKLLTMQCRIAFKCWAACVNLHLHVLVRKTSAKENEDRSMSRTYAAKIFPIHLSKIAVFTMIKFL